MGEALWLLMSVQASSMLSSTQHYHCKTSQHFNILQWGRDIAAEHEHKPELQASTEAAPKP